MGFRMSYSSRPIPEVQRVKLFALKLSFAEGPSRQIHRGRIAAAARRRRVMSPTDPIAPMVRRQDAAPAIHQVPMLDSWAVVPRQLDHTDRVKV